jgi:hypothetical protein
MNPLKADVKNCLDEYEPGESSYRALYEPLQSLTVDKLEVDLDELTRRLKISWDYLYGYIGVVNKQGDTRWPIDRKHWVEAEQRIFQRLLCQARRRCVKKRLDAGAVLTGKLPDSYLAAGQEIQRLAELRRACEAIVQAPFAYPKEERGLIHDVIVVLYEGRQDDDSIYFPLGEGVDIAKLRNSIAVAKDAAFEYYNQHGWWQIRRRLNPDDYSIRIYIDDYPGGMATQRFSGKSFTLAVSVGVCACLMKREVPSTVAFSAEVGTVDGQLKPIAYDTLKAKASRLSGITKLIVCADTDDRVSEAREGVFDAQRIQEHHTKKLPSPTEVISVKSLEGAWAQIPPTPAPVSRPSSEVIEKPGRRPGPLNPVLTTALVGILLLCVVVGLWLLFHGHPPVDVIANFEFAGWMGDGERFGEKAITLDDGWTKGAHAGATCVKFTYRQLPESIGWAGVYAQYNVKEKGENWGDLKGLDLTGYTQLVWYAKGEKGGELVKFKAGGIDAAGKPYKDSFEKSHEVVRLETNWKRYDLSLTGDLSSVIGGFCWIAKRDSNPDALTFYIDTITYE